jgi:ABC-2 type transport system permease protein
MSSISVTEKENSERGLALRENLRTLRVAAWLGWQIEGNWADPFVFLIFAVLRPMSVALILVVMYQVIAGGQRGDFFNYLYISNAFFVLVAQVMAGLSWSILDDRENYKMLKYIYTSPARKFSYLLGRSFAKVMLGILTTVLLLVVGALFLGVKIDLGRIEWGWLAIYFVLGIAILAGFGIILAGVSMLVARHGEAIAEVSAGSLLLFSGAYFPVDGLPGVLKYVSLGMPVTYWLEGMRRAIAGGILMTNTPGQGAQPISPILAALDNWQLLGIIGACAVGSVILAQFLYNRMEHLAKERGMIDRLTGY